MYNPETYLTLDVVTDVVAQFDWPAPYELEDELPDGVVMAFPRCHLLFDEGFESEVSIKFLTEDTGLATSLKLSEALLALKSTGFDTGVPPTLPLIHDRSPHASLAKVKNGLHDQCVIVLAHFRPCLQGDFRWVEAYKAYAARKRSTAT